jgi:uncharacterized coiled-coil protein SlyX
MVQGVGRNKETRLHPGCEQCKVLAGVINEMDWYGYVLDMEKQTVLKKAETEIRGREAKIRKLSHEKEVLINCNGSLEEQVRALQENARDSILDRRHLVSRMREQEACIRDQDGTIQGLRTQVRDLDTRIRDLDTRIRGQESTMQGLKTQVRDQESTMQGLKTQMDELYRLLSVRK